MVGKRGHGLALLAVLCAMAGACVWGAGAEVSFSPTAFATRSDAALRQNDQAAALTAARGAAAADPASVDAQHRLAFVSAAAAGAPTRETLAALDAAYDLSPFGTAAEMAWRVDFADAYWTGMPDPLAARALTQIEALGLMGDDWRPRVRWCRSAVTAALARAACATVPGVEQGADLNLRAGPPADP